MLLWRPSVPALHLTKSMIDELPPVASDVDYWDDSLAGFGSKVRPWGRKVFIVLYRTKDGFSRLRKYTIGPYRRIALVLARIAARKVWVLNRWKGRSIHEITRQDVLK